jgi:hypothetical protein
MPAVPVHDELSARTYDKSCGLQGAELANVLFKTRRLPAAVKYHRKSGDQFCSAIELALVIIFEGP